MSAAQSRYVYLKDYLDMEATYLFGNEHVYRRETSRRVLYIHPRKPLLVLFCLYFPQKVENRQPFRHNISI